MKRLLTAAFLAACLLGCAEDEKNPYSVNGNYGQLNNSREFGVVVTQQPKLSANVRGAAGTAGTAGGYAASNAATAAASQSSFLSPITGLFGSRSSPRGSSDDLNAVNTIVYVIQKDNGQQVTIEQTPSSGEQIVYPGQRVVIQWNGDYTRVYPADVENRRH